MGHRISVMMKSKRKYEGIMILIYLNYCINLQSFEPICKYAKYLRDYIERRDAF